VPRQPTSCGMMERHALPHRGPVQSSGLKPPDERRHASGPSIFLMRCVLLLLCYAIQSHLPYSYTILGGISAPVGFVLRYCRIVRKTCHSSVDSLSRARRDRPEPFHLVGSRCVHCGFDGAVRTIHQPQNTSEKQELTYRPSHRHSRFEQHLQRYWSA
jgi:hypothetical protein